MPESCRRYAAGSALSRFRRPAFIKLGFAGAHLANVVSDLVITAREAASLRYEPPAVIAVAYADSERVSAPDPWDLCEAARRGGARGVLLDTAGLKRTKDSFRVRLDGGKLSVTDGPFTETKEVVGGYALVQAQSDDEAGGIAREFMDLHRIHWPSFVGECEVRPLEQF